MFAAGVMMAITTANAVPGDDEAVAKARKDYAQAMKGHDAGLQNAMRAELSAQLAKSRKLALEKNKRPSNAIQPPAKKSSTS